MSPKWFKQNNESGSDLGTWNPENIATKRRKSKPPPPLPSRRRLAPASDTVPGAAKCTELLPPASQPCSSLGAARIALAVFPFAARCRSFVCPSLRCSGLRVALVGSSLCSLVGAFGFVGVLFGASLFSGRPCCKIKACLGMRQAGHQRGRV